MAGLDPDGYAFTASVPVRWSDMDAFGHVNHARMVTLMEEARISWLLSAGEEYQPLIKSAMIVHVDIRYQAQLRHDDTPLQIGMWIKGFRSVDFTIGYEIRGSGADIRAARPACVASAWTCRTPWRLPPTRWPMPGWPVPCSMARWCWA